MCRSPLLAPLAALVLVALVARVHAAVPVPAAPSVDVRAYILVDHHSGRVLAEHNADAPVEPASLTKLMAGYAVFKALKEDRLRLDEPVTISERAWRAKGSRTFVEVGTQVPVEALIKGMIVQSGNDATIALAERVAGTEKAFVQLMNEYARRLGMTSSHFENAPGMPGPRHRTSARDLALLSRAIIREFPDFYRWYGLREFTWNGISQPNRNRMLARDASVDGIKTGYTASAGYCLVTSADRGGMRLISIVLGAPDPRARADASAALLDYGYTFFETVAVKRRGETVLKPRLYKGEQELLALGPARDLYVTVARGSASALRTSATVAEPLVAPAATGMPLGELTVSDGRAVIARVPLVPLQPVAAGGWWRSLADTVALWFH